MPYLHRPAPEEFAPFYKKYIDLVPDRDVIALLVAQRDDTRALLEPLSETQALHRYDHGKWSVKEVVGHVTDAERVFAYRALRIARSDSTPLPGFDENSYVVHAQTDRRSLGELLEEYDAVRHATVSLLNGLPVQAWTHAGTANEKPISVRALAYIIAGHERHHIGLLKERYGIGG